MKLSPSPHDQQIIELLEKLGSLRAEYPAELLAARRAAFVAQIEQHNGAIDAEEISSNDPVIERLQILKSAASEYPAELLADRRSAFIAQIRQRNEAAAKQELPSREQVLEILQNMQAIRAEYPKELLASRRAAFIAQVDQFNRASVPEVVPAESGKLTGLLQRLKSIEFKYPRNLWDARRSTFIAQIRDGRVSLLEALHSMLRALFGRKSQTSWSPAPMRSLRQTLVVAIFVFAAFVGTVLYGNQAQLGSVLGTSHSQSDVAQPFPAATSTQQEVARTICKPGYLPPLCLAKEFDKSHDLTFPGNGARPAVAKDTIPGYSRIHRAAYINDGLYGPGASWISNSPYSWIKLDLGKTTTINTVAFGRDRLGNLNDGDPGQFVIAVALSDDVYADGNSLNDFREYVKVYDSEEVGFDGNVSGAETVQASFDAVRARYIKITFENPGTAIDEVEVFMIQPSGLAGLATQRPRDNEPDSTLTPVPTHTMVPSNTATAMPTSTPLPTNTVTPRPTLTPTDIPTNTPRPTLTPTEEPTNTPRPTLPPTDEPTNTPRPTTPPTDEPTNTPRPTTPPTDE
ncbi:MAG TPA: discoidin domain-containing protein, partial [Anaerolineales bacterium]|nr:discoidin domain-containing protein [Anaerolineales bacterium]